MVGGGCSTSAASPCAQCTNQIGDGTDIGLSVNGAACGRGTISFTARPSTQNSSVSKAITRSARRSLSLLAEPWPRGEGAARERSLRSIPQIVLNCGPLYSSPALGYAQDHD